MRRNIGKAVIALVATTMAVATLSMKAEAAEKNVTQKEVVVETEITEVPEVASEGTVRTGTLGDNNGIQWLYDESTKTLTVTGEDSGVQGAEVASYYTKSIFYNICSDVETIILRDCKIMGDASALFAYLENLKYLVMENFDTSQVWNMCYMFNKCSSLVSLDLSSLDTSQVMYMTFMFGECRGLKSLDISSFDTSKVSLMDSMFLGCISLKNLDLSNIDTSHVTKMEQMFLGCVSLENLDVSEFDTSKVKDMDYMFRRCSGLSILDLSNFDTSQVTSMRQMFEGCSNLSDLDLSNFDTSQVTDMSYMFNACSNLPSVDVSGFDTSKVIDMSGMFEDCKKLTSLSISDFDTSQVTNMASFFAGCSSLTNLDVSGFDTSRVTDMSHMFNNCISLTSLDVSDFDTSNVVDMKLMFCGCSVSSLDVSGFDTSNVTDMSDMFCACRSLTSLDVSSFDTSKVIDMHGMFADCDVLTSLDVSGFDTSNVINMVYMFGSCSNLTSLDVSGFDTSKVTEMNQMFVRCSSLAVICTPQQMAEGQVIALPHTFFDSEKNSTTELTSDFCNKTLTNTISNIKIESGLSEVTIGNTIQLSLNISGEAQDVTANTNYTWSVDNEKVATISENGLVTGVGMGTAFITCVDKENPSEIAYFKITIEVPFGDLKVTDWQYPYVVYAYDNNLMTGKGTDEKGNNIFAPNEGLTREQFAQILYSAEGKVDMNYTERFTDVVPGQWYTNAVLWAADKEIVSGYANGKYGVSDNITREQLAAMLYKYAVYKGYDTTARKSFDAFADASLVSDWATEQLQWAVANGIVNGKGEKLDPQGGATRAECAAMLKAFREKFED